MVAVLDETFFFFFGRLVDEVFRSAETAASTFLAGATVFFLVLRTCVAGDTLTFFKVRDLAAEVAETVLPPADLVVFFFLATKHYSIKTHLKLKTPTPPVRTPARFTWLLVLRNCTVITAYCNCGLRSDQAFLNLRVSASDDCSDA